MVESLLSPPAAGAQGKAVGEVVRKTAFSPSARHNASRCAIILLLGLPQEVAKKGTKGSNTPWIPAARKVVPLSLHSFFCEVIHLQLLQARLFLSRAHGSRTQARQQKLLLSVMHPRSTNFLSKTFLLPPPAARGGKVARDASEQICLSPIPLCSAAQEQFPKAAAFGSLSWFVLSRTRKNEHQSSTANACRGHSVSVKRRSRLKFSSSSSSPQRSSATTVLKTTANAQPRSSYIIPTFHDNFIITSLCSSARFGSYGAKIYKKYKKRKKKSQKALAIREKVWYTT